MSVIVTLVGKPLRGVSRLAARLGRDRSANALIEFAYALPIFLTLGMYGIELAYMATVNMQVSQIAMALADNASRLGQTDNSSVTPTVDNTDIDSIMTGAMTQGAGINFQTNGRVILSSLEKTSGGRQYIHWQKCKGSLSKTSNYGGENYGKVSPNITGLGKAGHIVSAPSTAIPVMFVEAFYSYRPLFGSMFVRTNPVFNQESAFLVRDDRDTTTSTPTQVGSECS